jgi:hypothetical protein
VVRRCLSVKHLHPGSVAARFMWGQTESIKYGRAVPRGENDYKDIRSVQGSFAASNCLDGTTNY